MGSAKITVTVVSRGRHVDGPLERPVRLTPDGDAGVVYGGLVYPVRLGDIVDLDAASFDKDACDTFLDAGEPIPYATDAASAPVTPLRVERWHIERNKFGNYLVLDGPETVAEAVVDRLDDAGFEIVRWDASHRAADDGYHYDWFVRFTYPGVFEDARTVIQDLLAGSGAAEPIAARARDAQGDELDAVRAENRALRQQVADLEIRARAVSARLEAERANTSQATEVAERLQGHVNAYRAKASGLEIELNRERARKAAPSHAEPAHVALFPEQDRLLTRALHAEDEWLAAQQKADALEQEVGTLRADRNGLRAQLAAASDQVEELAARLAETAAEPAEVRRTESARRTGRAGRHTPDEFLARLLRRVSLDVTAVDELLNFPKPLEVIKALIRLQEKDCLPGKALKGSLKHRLLEVDKHFTTGDVGNADMGRIYYCPRPDGTLSVLVHRKRDGKDQERVIHRFDDRIDDLPPALDGQDQAAS